MKTQLENKASRLNLNLGIVVLVCFVLSLGFNNVFAGRPSMPIDGGSGSGASTQPNLEEARTALGMIQDAQENYKLIHGEYFFSLETAELETALGIELPGKQDFYYAAGTGPVGTAQAIDSDVTCTIYDTDAEATCLCADCGQPQGGGNRFILSDSDFPTSGPVHSSPVMINLDADDEGELIVGSDDGNVYAWDYDEVQGWIAFIDPVNNLEGIFAQTDAGFNVKSTPAIDDINIVDNDGLKEVVVGTNARKVYVWRIMDPLGTPTVENVLGWPKTTGSFQYIVNSAVLANLDSDSDLEIIVAGQNGAVYVWDPDGVGLVNPADGFFAQAQGNVNSSPAVGDLDNDGYKEIVVAAGNKLFVWYYNYDTEQVVGLINTNGLFVQVGSTIYSSPALADIDGDGFFEVIVGSDDNKLYAFNHDASPVEAWPDETAGWPQLLGGKISSSPSIANIKTYPEAIDAEYDQDLEIVVGAENGEVYAFHHDGRKVSGWTEAVDRTNDDMNYLHDSSPALADIDGDGDIEVIIGCWDGKLYAYHDDGSPVSGWPKPADPDIMGAIELSSPSIGLLGNTEFLDVAIGSTDSFIYTWELNGTFSTDAMPWPKYRLDYRNTATYQRADRVRPYIDDISDRVVEIEEPLSFSVDAHDDAGQTIIDISAYDVPSGANFSYTSGNNSGTFNWTPALADVNPEPYRPSFIATDEYGLHSERVYVNITVVEPACAAPIANPESYNNITEDTLFSILAPGVLGNDISPVGNPLIAIEVDPPTHADSFTLNSDGSFDYMPAPDYNGPDSFTYKAHDAICAMDSDTVTVNITVDSVNDPPEADDDSYIAYEGHELVVAASGVLENDIDIDGPNPLIAIQASDATNGTAVLNPDGSFTYTPNPDYIGLDSFTYVANDGIDDSEIATVNIDVLDYVCDGPVRLYDETGDLVECFNNIQPAINYSTIDHGYTIRVSPGTYYENLLFNIDKAITVESTGAASNTIIDGGQSGTVVIFDSATSAVTFEGFKIRNGLTSGDGGGILVSNAPVNINDCIVKYNYAGVKGGGIACRDSDVNITNTDFINNSAGVPSAKSMYVAGAGLVTVSHCLIKQEPVIDDVCLLPGTKIQLADGTAKSIEEVNIGDEVLAINKEGQVASGKVLQTFYHPDRQGFYVIKTEDGNTLKITGNHPVHNCKDFVEAGSLKIGDKILVVNSKDKSRLLHSKIVSMIKEDSFADVYNLEVDFHHTYIADGVVVHNKKMKKINEIESP